MSLSPGAGLGGVGKSDIRCLLTPPSSMCDLHRTQMMEGGECRLNVPWVLHSNHGEMKAPFRQSFRAKHITSNSDMLVLSSSLEWLDHLL